MPVYSHSWGHTTHWSALYPYAEMPKKLCEIFIGLYLWFSLGFSRLQKAKERVFVVYNCRQEGVVYSNSISCLQLKCNMMAVLE